MKEIPSCQIWTTAHMEKYPNSQFHLKEYMTNYQKINTSKS